ncbi:hypothetical protein GGR56DRAFT_654126 [Xylariaceae sp. FL0804]|nr:hypothetical protein GGR56DRAFT_654126 [Xylariaceae sp. FL0804]
MTSSIPAAFAQIGKNLPTKANFSKWVKDAEDNVDGLHEQASSAHRDYPRLSKAADTNNDVERLQDAIKEETSALEDLSRNIQQKEQTMNTQVDNLRAAQPGVDHELQPLDAQHNDLLGVFLHLYGDFDLLRRLSPQHRRELFDREAYNAKDHANRLRRQNSELKAARHPELSVAEIDEMQHELDVTKARTESLAADLAASCMQMRDKDIEHSRELGLANGTAQRAQLALSASQEAHAKESRRVQELEKKMQIVTDEKDKQIEDLRASAKRDADEITDLRNKLRQAALRAVDESEQLENEHNNIVTDLNTKVNEAEIMFYRRDTEAREAKEDRDQIKIEWDMCKDSLDKSVRACRERQEQLRKAESALEQVRKSLQDTSKRADDLDASLRNSEELVKAAEVDKNQLLQSLEQMPLDHATEVRRIGEEHAAEVQRLTADRDELRRQEARLQSEIQGLKDGAENATLSARAAQTASEERISSLEGQLASLEIDLHNGREEAQSAQDLAGSRISGLEDQLANLQTELQKAREAAKRTQDADDARIASLEGQLADLHTELQKAKEAAKSTKDANDARVADLEGQLADLHTELQKAREAAKSNKDADDARAAGLESRIETLDDRVRDLTSQLTAAQGLAMATKLTDQVEIDVLTCRVYEEQADLDRAVAAHQGVIDGLDAQVRELDAQVWQLQTALDALRADAAAAATDAETELEAAQAARSAAKDRVQDLQGRLDASETTVAEATHRVAELNTELSILKVSKHETLQELTAAKRDSELALERTNREMARALALDAEPAGYLDIPWIRLAETIAAAQTPYVVTDDRATQPRGWAVAGAWLSEGESEHAAAAGLDTGLGAMALLSRLYGHVTHGWTEASTFRLLEMLARRCSLPDQTILPDVVRLLFTAAHERLPGLPVDRDGDLAPQTEIFALGMWRLGHHFESHLGIPIPHLEAIHNWLLQLPLYGSLYGPMHRGETAVIEQSCREMGIVCGRVGFVKVRGAALVVHLGDLTLRLVSSDRLDFQDTRHAVLKAPEGQEAIVAEITHAGDLGFWFTLRL